MSLRAAAGERLLVVAAVAATVALVVLVGRSSATGWAGAVALLLLTLAAYLPVALATRIGGFRLLVMFTTTVLTEAVLWQAQGPGGRAGAASAAALLAAWLAAVAIVGVLARRRPGR